MARQTGRQEQKQGGPWRGAGRAFHCTPLCDRGELPHVRIGNAIRIAPADLAAFMARQRSGGR